MRHGQPAFLAMALVVVLAAPAIADDGESSRFTRQIRPLLERHCVKCHGPAQQKGGLRLDTSAAATMGGLSGEVLAPGLPDESPLLFRVEDDEMPPDAPLSADEKTALRQWIAAGAHWDDGPPLAGGDEPPRASLDWWSLQPLSNPQLPTVDATAGSNPIDAFLIDRLIKAGLPHNAPAPKQTLIRRLTFDLTGLPPTPDEIDRFLNDDAPDAYERLVDRLLASPQYGVRWARFWLDLARYGESNGFEHDEFRPDAWRYRDWVVNAMNADLPYDEFTRLQIAGDVLHPTDPSAVEATGFLVAGAYDTVGQQQQSEAMRKVVRQDEMEDLVGTVSQTFLGLTVHCARCHDHKFDPITQAEYYQFAASLSGVRHGVRDLTDLDPRVTDARRTLQTLRSRQAELENEARRTLGQGEFSAPVPVAAWDFSQSPDDRVRGLVGRLQNGASQSDDGLRVDGRTGYLATKPIEHDLTERTLEVWVQLDTLDQAGGGAISIQRLDGQVFDAIVFGEREPGRWMAGSESFVRTQSFNGPEELVAADRPVHVAITYAADGTIRGYRDGKPYGSPYKTAKAVTFQAGNASILFGLRHEPTGGNRALAGAILRARLYDRALEPEEIEASYQTGGAWLTPEQVADNLSEAKQREYEHVLASASELRDALSGPLIRRAYAVSPDRRETTFLLLRGNPAQPTERMSPGGLHALATTQPDFGLNPDAADASSRAALANWITDPANPLFARVMVNRLWQAHFGAGLVETPSDFGFNGGQPSHPELLDWLAVQFRASGFRLKPMHRLIVTSAAYRRSSLSSETNQRVDASNRLLWRKSPTRLESEMVRDAMLAVAGTLDLTMGGPGFREYTIRKAEGTITNQYFPRAVLGPDLSRRTLYRTWARGGRSGFLDVFDCPDPSTTTPRRAITTTPLQALTLLNDELTLGLANQFAERLQRDAGGDVAAQVDRAYQLAFGRLPDDSERNQSLSAASEHGLNVLTRAIFNANEFLYVD